MFHSSISHLLISRACERDCLRRTVALVLTLTFAVKDPCVQRLLRLSYTRVQKHDARLDRLIKGPEREIVRLVNQDKNMTWKLLALRAGSIQLGMIRKY